MQAKDTEEAHTKLRLDDYRKWRELWEQMMGQYCPGRSSLFDLILNLIRFTVKGPRLSVLDVGCGAGSFTARVLETFPRATVCAVDRSSRHLHIGATLQTADDAAGDSRVTWIRANVGSEKWTSALPGEPFDVVFMGWLTHEIEPWRLPGLYKQLAASIRPGGLLLNVDFMTGLKPGFQDMAVDLTRSGVTGEWREFSAWFDEQLYGETQAPEDQEQRTRWIVHHARDLHLREIAAAGFPEAEEVWRYLNSALIMAVR